MSKTLMRIFLFHLVFGLLSLPLYLILKTGVCEYLFLYVPLLSIAIATYMEMVEGNTKNENTQTS